MPALYVRKQALRAQVCFAVNSRGELQIVSVSTNSKTKALEATMSCVTIQIFLIKFQYLAT